MRIILQDTLGALLRGTSSFFGGATLLGGLSTYASSSKDSVAKAVSSRPVQFHSLRRRSHPNGSSQQTRN